MRHPTTRWPFRLSLLAAAIALEFGMAPSVAAAAPAIRLLVRVKGDEIRVLDARRLESADAKGAVATPLLTAKSWTRYSPGTSEYLIAWYDAHGKRIASYGLPRHSLYFYDEITPGEDGDLHSGPYRPRHDDRIVDVPLPLGARYLTFFRSKVVLNSTPPTNLAVPGSPVQNVGSRVERRQGTTPQTRRRIDLTALSGYDVQSFVDSMGGLPGPDGLPPRPPVPEPPPAPPPVPPDPRPTVPHLPRLTSPFPELAKGSFLIPLTDIMLQFVCPPLDGTFFDVVPLRSAGSPSSKFDFVILGDGFDASEMEELLAWAKRYDAALGATEPFKTLIQQNRINVFLVRTISTESGITNCTDRDGDGVPDGVVKTAFHVEGQWIDRFGLQGPPGFFGTDDLCRVWAAASHTVAFGTDEVIVMIANCPVFGGSAAPDVNMAFVPTITNTDYFELLGLHESAHAIAKTLEEYVSCVGEDPTIAHPNIEKSTTPGPTAWWKSLAVSGELDRSGNFKAVYQCGASYTVECSPAKGACCMPVMDDPSQTDMLGMFWGAQWGDPAGTPIPECDPFCDTLGTQQMPMSCEWYRPMATCKMRRLAAPFCRVCQELLRRAVVAASP